jgi:hypothetical protein
MARAYSGREWGCLIGVTDLSASVIGAVTDAANPSGVIAEFRVDNPLADIAWDAGYQRAEIERAGGRAFESTDIINQYGSGSWTWDFSYVAENERALQILLELIYPSGYTTGVCTVPAEPVVNDMVDGVAPSPDVNSCGFVVLQNPLAAKDRVMHNAVLQNLTITMDAGTNGGRPTVTGQFMSGYKPTIAANTVAASGAGLTNTWAKGLFDCDTTSFGGAAATIKSFSMTIENPASRVGFKGTAGETDGYVRASALKVTGSCSLKADSVVQAYLESKWQSNALFAIDIGDSTSLDIQVPSANISAFTMDMADEGMFADISWTATSGVGGASSVAVLTMT